MRYSLLLILSILCSRAYANEFIEVLEWEGVIDPGICNISINNNEEIEQFFRLAVKVDNYMLPISQCYVEGVARNSDLKVVDFKIYSTGFGSVIFENGSIIMRCIKGTECCNKLPNLCATKP